ncbi:LacI family DNA-binding transcriptional regulator, partial [Streptococcus pneumoniae]
MVTIKDIARVSGVSHGTVSNVLNKKGNVSAAKIKLVEE